MWDLLAKQSSTSLYSKKPNAIFSMDFNGRSIKADNVSQDPLELLIKMIEHRFPGTSGAFHHMLESSFFLETCFAPNLSSEYCQSRKVSPIIDEVVFWNEWRDHALEQGLHLCWSNPILSSDTAVIGLASVYADTPQIFTDSDLHFLQSITELAGLAIEKKLQDHKKHRLAFYDRITGLSNRHHFQFELQKTIKGNNKKQSQIGVLFIGIDRFKPINDTFGHAAGDLFLLKAAHRLQSCLENNTMLARIGGDEFGILVPGLKNENQLLSLAEQIMESWKRPVSINGFETVVTVSIGASILPCTLARDSESLMKNADIALHKAKENGKNQIQIYAPYMEEQIYNKFVLASEFHRALMMNEFVLYYQPRHDIASDTIECVEALIRWNHPVRGLIAPAEFIPLSEETGFILTLGQWVLDEACRQAEEWRRSGIPFMRIAINVSALQFKQPHFLEGVKQALLRHHLDAKWLEIEITESALMQSEDCNIAILHELSSLGIQVSIDDFGTGYSSLNYLKKFKVSALKIDKSFVHDLPDDVITKSIIQLAKSLDLRTIAEGVELQEQLDFLKKQGCDQVQGFLIAKPVAPENMLQFLKDKQKQQSCMGEVSKIDCFSN